MKGTGAIAILQVLLLLLLLFTIEYAPQSYIHNCEHYYILTKHNTVGIV